MAAPPDPGPPGEIGVLTIGESAIGDSLFNWWNTILSQFANSPVIIGLIDDLTQNLDATPWLSAWYDELWNVLTAQGYGLDVWGRIVGVQRNLPIEPVIYFGFSNGGVLYYAPFDQGPLYSGEVLLTNYTLTDQQFLPLILAKAAANIWNGSTAGLNLILRLLFPGQTVYVVDNQNMSINIVFNFALQPWQVAVLLTSNVMPRPSGVAVTYIQT